MKQKEKFVRAKDHCNIGTIGHVDHGKTTLTSAITKVLSRRVRETKFVAYSDIDKHAEERRRGITIVATHVEYETSKRHYSHIDCPGHQDYIKNMITGAIQMDGVILVVSVVDGPQVQTREHVILAKEIGIPYMVVFVNKMDALKEPDMVNFVEMETRELVSSYGFSYDLPMIFGSARVALEEDTESKIGGLAILELMNIVDTYIKQPVRNLDEPFLMPVEDVFSITGRGTVVTGRVERGVLKIGEEVELVGSKVFRTLCTGLEMFKKILDFAQAGDNVGILVRGVARTDVSRGYVVAHVGTCFSYLKFDARAYILTKGEGGRGTPFYSNYRPQFFFRTSNVTGTIKLKEGIELVMPGDTVEFSVELQEAVALNVGLRFTLREGRVTVGGGVIVRVYN
jgi:elongation factor Tu